MRFPGGERRLLQLSDWPTFRRRCCARRVLHVPLRR
jgi:hypothetical protein